MRAQYVKRPGWTRIRPGLYALEGTGYRAEHCGHPTAIWPWSGIRPDGRIVAAPSGLAFATLNAAQVALEELAAADARRAPAPSTVPLTPSRSHPTPTTRPEEG